jgi:hypothetical protein
MVDIPFAPVREQKERRAAGHGHFHGSFPGHEP